MAKFHIDVLRTILERGWAEIEAESKDEARDIATEQLLQEDVDWHWVTDSIERDDIESVKKIAGDG